MTSGGWGSSWGGVPWGGTGIGVLPPTEHIPTSDIWTRFDLTGVRQANDMDRVQAFIEVSTYGVSTQFFINSFNIYAGGGTYPATPAAMDMDVTVLSNFTVEWRVALNQLPNGFSDLLNAGILLGANNAAGTCAAIMLSEAGIGYTGSFRFDGSGVLELGHVLDPAGATLADRSLYIIPGSEDWFSEGDEVYVRIIADPQTEIVYLYITPAEDITPGVVGVSDSTGHVLRALLPRLVSDDSTFAVIDRVANYVNGTAGEMVGIELFHYNFSDKLLIPNLPPRAVTGGDQATRLCSIVQLDGSGSFDPEGESLTYDWRLIDAPDNSLFALPGADGSTAPQAPPTGFTRYLYSEELALEHAISPILPGDVLVVGGVGYTILSAAPEGVLPFFVATEYSQLSDSLSGVSFKLIRQAAVSGAQTATPTFYPDKPGFYLFDLRVFDGTLWSTPSGLNRATTLVNVLESPLPRGCTPDLGFIYDYLSDFWQLIEDPGIFSTLWSGLAQVAATELFTLWQHEYSKSIRDIQRTFTRRWLHYDLLLGEPLPALTRIKSFFGGVYSTAFTPLRVYGTQLVISSPVLVEPVAVAFTTQGIIDPEVFAEGLGRHLRGNLHSSFSVQLVQYGGTYKLRIDAPFQFAIAEGTTTSLFTVGDTNSVASGTGHRVLERTFRVDRSLQGLAVVDCFLVVGEDSYVIERVIDNAADPYPYQRVVLREQLDGAITEDTSLEGSSWVICGWVSSELLDFYNGLAVWGDHAFLEVTEIDPELSSLEAYTGNFSVRVFGASPTFPGRLPLDLTAIGHLEAHPALSVRLASVLRRGRIPVDDSILDVPVLQEGVVVVDDTQSLRRNLDFFLESYRGKNSIRFVSGQGGGPDVFEGELPPERLWAEYTYVDNSKIIEAHFGSAVGFTLDQAALLPDSVDYLSGVSGLLYAYSHGPAIRNIRIGTQILLGLPFAEEEGVIKEIRSDLPSQSGRFLIQDVDNPEVVRSYSYPKILDIEVNPSTGLPYAEGDQVTRFAPLVEGVEIVDYVKEPRWFQGLVSQGVFEEPQKYHTFAVRVDVRAFSLNSLITAKNFVVGIKPSYTRPRVIVQLKVSGEDGDEISIGDDIVSTGALALDDGIAPAHLGGSLVFDQAWPGGGQPWAGDTSLGTGTYRNRFDNGEDPDSPAVYPTPQPVLWGFDKEYDYPSDLVAAHEVEVFATSFTPTAASVFGADEVRQCLRADEVEASPGAGFTIPSGAVGYVIALASSTLGQTGTVSFLNIQLLGSAGDPLVAEVDFEVVVRNITQATSTTQAFTASMNTERNFVLSLGVTAGDTLALSVRTASQSAATPSWTRILASVEASFTWNFASTLAAGTYCGRSTLAGTP